MIIEEVTQRAERLNHLWQTDFTYRKVVQWGRYYLSTVLDDGSKGLTHMRGKSYHPMTQGKIERYHRSMKSLLLLDNYYSPDDVKAETARFVDHCNHRRYHGSLDNVTPADV